MKNINGILKQNAAFVVVMTVLVAIVILQRNRRITETSCAIIELTVISMELGHISARKGQSLEELRRKYLDYLKTKYPSLVERYDSEHSDQDSTD